MHYSWYRWESSFHFILFYFILFYSFNSLYNPTQKDQPPFASYIRNIYLILTPTTSPTSPLISSNIYKHIHISIYSTASYIQLYTLLLKLFKSITYHSVPEHRPELYKYHLRHHQSRTQYPSTTQHRKNRQNHIYPQPWLSPRPAQVTVPRAVPPRAAIPANRLRSTTSSTTSSHPV